MRPQEPIPEPRLAELPFDEDITGRLRISSSADTVAVIPYLLGYHPRESVVVMVHVDARVVLTARLPIQIVERPTELQYRVGQLIAQHPTAQWLLVAYSADRDRAADAIEKMLAHLVQTDLLEVVDALVVSAGKFWSQMCNDADCCPPEGQSYDPITSPIAVQAVVNGLQAMPDRENLVDRVRPPRGGLARTARRRVDQAFDHLQVIGVAEAEALFGELLDCGLTDPAQLDEDELALMAAVVSYGALRDIALRRINQIDAEQHVALWQRVARATPREHQAPVLGVLGLASWVGGDGAMQVVCLERGEKIEPGHVLLGLLDEINKMAVPPSVWGQLLADLPEAVPSAGQL